MLLTYIHTKNSQKRRHPETKDLLFFRFQGKKVLVQNQYIMNKFSIDLKQFYNSSMAMLKSKWLPFALGIPLFFCLHHYEGIKNDAILYLLQAIHSISPERFVNDPPFMFGNQDSLGFFTPLYRLFITNFTIASGTKLATFIFQSIWIVSFIFMVREIGTSFKNRLWILPITILSIGICADKMPHFKVLFVDFVHHYNCSRLLSIALGLAGLAFLFSKRKWFSLFFFFIGTIIHPLSAGWGLPVWFLVFYPKTKYAIILFSALLPLSFLFHSGSLDIIPDNWFKRPLTHATDIWDLFRIVSYIFFLGYFIPRKESGHLSQISKAIAITLFIAYYWNLWGYLGKHALLYQLQTWRAEWLAWAVVTPFFLNILFVEIRKKKHFPTFITSRSCFALCMLFLSLFPPLNTPFFFLVAYIDQIKPFSYFSKKILYFLRLSKYNGTLCALGFILLFFCIVSVAYANIVELALEGSISNIFLCGNFRIAQLLTRSNMMVCTFISIIFAIYSLSIRKRIAAICFGIYIIFPMFLFIPLLGLFLLFFDMQKKRTIVIGTALLFFSLIEGLSSTQFRCHFFFDIFAVYFKPVLLSWLFIISVWFLSFIAKKAKSIIILFLILPTSLYAFCSWDNRPENVKRIESAFELFKKETIFPYVHDRGKIFFYVTGDLVSLPRIQFLTGAYLSANTHIGEPFYPKQFFEAQKRDNYLFYKKQLGIANEIHEYITFASTTLSSPDTLADRINFLCKIKEITHLVSDIPNLPYQPLDSLTLHTLDKEIYLYSCPN